MRKTLMMTGRAVPLPSTASMMIEVFDCSPDSTVEPRKVRSSAHEVAGDPAYRSSTAPDSKELSTGTRPRTSARSCAAYAGSCVPS
jgi:hypothetical protein